MVRWVPLLSIHTFGHRREVSQLYCPLRIPSNIPQKRVYSHVKSLHTVENPHGRDSHRSLIRSLELMQCYDFDYYLILVEMGHICLHPAILFHPWLSGFFSLAIWRSIMDLLPSFTTFAVLFPSRPVTAGCGPWRTQLAKCISCQTDIDGPFGTPHLHTRESWYIRYLTAYLRTFMQYRIYNHKNKTKCCII